MPADAFGAADGGFIETLMRHTPAPLPSRWLSMLLRRTLAAELDTPAGLNGADYAAERAWLLLRMGESVVARGVVERVDNRDYTPKLYQVAMNAMLATGDPGGLCPLADGGLRATGEVGWVFAQPICASLTGQGEAARAQFQAARRRRLAGGIDVLLAEKVMGAGGQGRRAVTIEWDGVDRLTPWRFGLANATGVAIPETMFATTGAQVRYWQALSPMLAPAARLTLAEAAGAQGVRRARRWSISMAWSPATTMRPRRRRRRRRIWAPPMPAYRRCAAGGAAGPVGVRSFLWPIGADRPCRRAPAGAGRSGGSGPDRRLPAVRRA